MSFYGSNNNLFFTHPVYLENILYCNLYSLLLFKKYQWADVCKFEALERHEN